MNDADLGAQVVCTRWGRDPMARGSYSSIAVGALGGEEYDTLAEQVYILSCRSCRASFTACSRSRIMLPAPALPAVQPVVIALPFLLLRRPFVAAVL